MAGFITAVEFQPIKSHVRNTCELSKMKVKHCHCEIEPSYHLPTTHVLRRPKIIKSIRPSKVAANAVTNIAEAWLLRKNCVMSLPSPGSPLAKKKSPTMAPMTARPAEMRKPLNIAGLAAGN